MDMDEFRSLIDCKFGSCSAFADKIGVDRTTVSKYLSRDRMPGVEMLRKMAEALHCEFIECVGVFYGK